MAKGFKCGAGGGGSDLLLTVNAYASADALPATAAESAVGVITTTPISSWIFSPNEPESPEEGVFWGEVDIVGELSFNPLKKNCIALFPVSARQFIGGAWSMVEAWVYTAGAWAQFGIAGVYLYAAGDICEAVTGGYELINISGTPSVTYGETSMIVYAARHPSVGQYKKSIVRTANRVDLTGFDTLTLEGTVEGTGAGWSKARLCAWPNAPTSIDADRYIELTNGSDPVHVDVSDLVGEHYIGFAFDCTNVQIQVTVNELRLE